MPDRALTERPADPAPAESVRRFGTLSASGQAAGLSPSFLMRALDGGIDLRPDPAPNGAAGLARLCAAIDGSVPEELEAGYVIIAPRAGRDPLDSGVWLLKVRDGLLAAAFEFATREEAEAAAPVCSQRICGEKLVEQAVWAVVGRDLAGLLAIVDEDFTYTDLKRDFTLSGAATAVNHLLLMGYFGVKTITGLEITALSSQAVQVTGSVVEPDPFADADECGRWRMVVGVEAGRITWAVHHPDVRSSALT